MSDSTTDVFLSAYFDPASIRHLRTMFTVDASFRYERGRSDVLICALKRAALLILEIAGGHRGPFKKIIPIDRKSLNWIMPG